jgi:disulfide bond formation protein DsbB
MPSKSHRALRLSVIALSIVLVLFGGILLTLIHTSSLPGMSPLPTLGQGFYLFSAFVLAVYFFLEWRNESFHESRLASEPDRQSVKIVIIESLSEKILRWIVSIMVLGIVMISLGFLLICAYGVYKKPLQLQPTRLFLGELILIGTVISIYVAWKILSIHRRKLLLENVGIHSNNAD